MSENTPTVASSTWLDKLQATLAPGAVVGYLGWGMWISDFAGHPALGTFFHDPHTASVINNFIAASFNLVALVSHQFTAHALIQARK